jgi:hypothetical protein
VAGFVATVPGGLATVPVHADLTFSGTGTRPAGIAATAMGMRLAAHDGSGQSRKAAGAADDGDGSCSGPERPARLVRSAALSDDRCDDDESASAADR